MTEKQTKPEQTSAASPSRITTHPLIGVMGVLLGASIATFQGRLVSVGLSQCVMAIGLALAFNGLVGSIILEVVNTGALTRPIDVLTFGGFFQTVRLLGGEIGAAVMQHFLSYREQFHSNILGLGAQLGQTATDHRLLALKAGMARHASGPDVATARAAEILTLQVRGQALTLAIADGFALVAFAAVPCLFVVACMGSVQTQYRQVTATPVAQPA